MHEEKIDEILEHIWTHEEEFQNRVNRNMVAQWIDPGSVETVLADMERKGLVRLYDSLVVLSASGRKAAEQIIRRHRLAERLLKDVLDVGHEAMDSTACQFEHFLSEEVTTSICTLLGHPVRCPHGKIIPPGECCQREKKKTLRPLVQPLCDLSPGEEGKVAYITTKSHPRLDRLSSLGLLPGTSVRVHQKQPTLVIFMGETQLALDEDTARDIYIRRS
ncbi:MAG: metal-dependent transcriptional regulator [Planctomycetota bacterium]|jgi:DtxR family Mn-dependent transcriptional regulator